MEKAPEKKIAAVYVDFEYWYISLQQHHLKPNIKAWYQKLTSKYNIRHLGFFASFRSSGICEELSKIREVTNMVIETQNSGTYCQKDFSDFIMVDYIYHQAMNPEQIDTYIIFTGDGHFSIVANFLKSIGKEVGIYGVEGSFSSLLKSTATWTAQLPEQDDIQSHYVDLLLNNFLFVDTKAYKALKPTFWKTIETVSRHNNEDDGKIKDALSNLLSAGYLYQTEERLGLSKMITVIHADWKKIKEAHITDLEIPEKLIE